MKIKVKSNESALVPDHRALGSERRYIGRVFNSKLGVKGGWELIEEGVEIEQSDDVLQAIKCGDLIKL